jgi:predicted amidophosphoribosyltransferase
MPTCAVCENVQAVGEGCDVCGHPFPAEVRTFVPVEPLEGLEQTRLAPVEAPVESVPDLEATRIDPVQVVAAAMEGLEPTLADEIPGDDAPSGPPAATCRYCRTPAMAGEAFCSHCGMRLPSTGEVVDLVGEPLRCRECGTPVRGSSCPGCGAQVSR